MMVLILATDDNYYDDTAITCKPSAKGKKKRQTFEWHFIWKKNSDFSSKWEYSVLVTVCVYEIVPEVYAGGSNIRQPEQKKSKRKIKSLKKNILKDRNICLVQIDSPRDLRNNDLENIFLNRIWLHRKHR